MVSPEHIHRIYALQTEQVTLKNTYVFTNTHMHSITQQLMGGKGHKCERKYEGTQGKDWREKGGGENSIIIS